MSVSKVPARPPIEHCIGCGAVTVVDSKGTCAECTAELVGYAAGRRERALSLFQDTARTCLISGASLAELRGRLDVLDVH